MGMPLVKVVLFCACLGYSSALKCYTCHSDVMVNCGDSFIPKGIEMPTCPNDMEQGVCTKTKGDDVVARGCGQKGFCRDDVTGGEDSCQTTSGTTRCCCKADGCNSATNRRADRAILVTTTGLAVLLLVDWGSVS